MKVFEKVVPDTSVIVEGIISKQIESKELSIKKIIVHEAVIAELESQANKNRETGYLGLDEIEKLRTISEDKKISLEFSGQRPGDFEIKFAKSGEIDSIIRELANKEKATLLTADIVQAKVAEAKGIDVYFYEFSNDEEKQMFIEKFFDNQTIEIQLKENLKVLAKKGLPGNTNNEYVSQDVISKEELQDFSKDVIETAKLRKDSFIETEKRGSTIAKVGRYRIAITRPPFSKTYEISAKKQIKNFKLKEYGITNNITENSSGILVIGCAGSGKSTFTQALANDLIEKNKKITTIETPRMFNLPNDVSQYNFGDASSQEIREVLLINKPEIVIFDELKGIEEFRLFIELRYVGIKTVATWSSESAFSALQRFVKKNDLRMITSIFDKIIFIENGAVAETYSILDENSSVIVKDSKNNEKFKIVFENNENVVLIVNND